MRQRNLPLAVAVAVAVTSALSAAKRPCKSAMIMPSSRMTSAAFVNHVSLSLGTLSRTAASAAVKETNMRHLNMVLNAALIAMALAMPFVASHGYSKWVAMEDARRGQ